MKQIFKEEELIDKVIDRVVTYKNQIVMYFKDKTFSIFNYVNGNCKILSDLSINITPNVSNCNYLYGIGMITLKEYNDIQKEQEKIIKLQRIEYVERYIEQYSRELLELKKELKDEICSNSNII